ncbi:unnamed protein product [Thlaspi arvense]|uniref:Cystatin domain-containing protein n=1 Tax=Thlaspi arvense TaxID=13288 RepID=A0AAU9SCA3_THLAR|nr:unnamed protein product [Thlaspi arvense]
MKEEIGYLCGGWGPVRDIKDPHVEFIAKFAISEHNKQNNSGLRFQKKVVSGDMQPVSGMNYRLVFDVSDGDDGGSKTYEAQVYQACLDCRALAYFKPVN